MAALQARNFGEAERRFKSFLKKQPKHVGALNLLTITLMTMERFAEAEEFIARALKIDQRSERVRSTTTVSFSSDCASPSRRSNSLTAL